MVKRFVGGLQVDQHDRGHGEVTKIPGIRFIGKVFRFAVQLGKMYGIQVDIISREVAILSEYEHLVELMYHHGGNLPHGSHAPLNC